MFHTSRVVDNLLPLFTDCGRTVFFINKDILLFSQYIACLPSNTRQLLCPGDFFHLSTRLIYAIIIKKKNNYCFYGVSDHEIKMSRNGAF